MRPFAAVLLAFLLPSNAQQVIGISDGDTLTVLSEGRPLRVRLANIDAPEKKQPFGESSKKSLSELCFQRNAVLTSIGFDRYGRTVAVVHCDDTNANVAQVERGMAWVYPKYNHDPSLPAVEARARELKVGLWSDPAAIEPWRYRMDRRAAIRQLKQ